MILKTTRFLAQVLFLVAVLLLAASLIGLFTDYDARAALDPGKSPPETIYSEVHESFESHGKSPDFVKEALGSFHRGMIFTWPRERARVPLTDNWLLYALSHVEGTLNRIGVISVEDFFSVYQSLRYERAIERGFGICSQNAVAFSDLLERKYGMQTQIVFLDGHVISSVTLDGRQIVIDPSIGWYSGKTLNELETQSEYVLTELSKLQMERLAPAYDAEGNQVFASVSSYNPKMKKLEHLLDYLKFLLPLFLLALSGGFLFHLRRRRLP